MKVGIVRVICLLSLFTFLWAGSAAASGGNLTNPGFETGDLSGWTKGTVVDFAGVVGPDGFGVPNEGDWMVRLGSPLESGQPVGPNVIYQDFDVVEPSLSFAYQIFTYDYTGYNHFHYRVLDVETGETIEYFSQGAWGTGGTLKSTGWQTATVDLSGYIGKRVRLEIDCGGTKDQENGTWAYVDAVRITAPSSTVSLSPEPNTHGWNNSDVTVTLSSASSGDGGGVEIHYSIDGGPETVVDSPSASFVLTDEGVHRVSYYSTCGGAVESPKTITVKIDKTKPAVVIKSPAADYYLTSGKLAIDSSISDDLSGLESGTMTLDSVPVSNGLVLDLSGIAGKHLLKVVAEDRAGNTETKSAGFEVCIAASVDIEPESLNQTSESDKSAMTAYVEFPKGYQVELVDPLTVEMEIGDKIVKAQAFPSSLGDYDGDGVPDLMVKFDRSLVIEALDGVTGDVLMKVTGQLSSGLTFQGTDEVRVFRNG